MDHLQKKTIHHQHKTRIDQFIDKSCPFNCSFRNFCCDVQNWWCPKDPTGLVSIIFPGEAFLSDDKCPFELSRIWSGTVGDVIKTNWRESLNVIHWDQDHPPPPFNHQFVQLNISHVTTTEETHVPKKPSLGDPRANNSISFQ